MRQVLALSYCQVAPIPPWLTFLKKQSMPEPCNPRLLRHLLNKVHLVSGAKDTVSILVATSGRMSLPRSNWSSSYDEVNVSKALLLDSCLRSGVLLVWKQRPILFSCQRCISQSWLSSIWVIPIPVLVEVFFRYHSFVGIRWHRSTPLSLALAPRSRVLLHSAN